MGLDYKVIGARIKDARLAKNLTQQVLSEQLDFSVGFLSKIETGNSQPNLKRLSQICDILDVSEGYILNGSDSDKDNYLNKEFSDLLSSCTPEEQKMIYEVAKTILKNY